MKLWIKLTIILFILIAVYVVVGFTNLVFMIGSAFIIVGVAILGLAIILIVIGLYGLRDRVRKGRAKQ